MTRTYIGLGSNLEDPRAQVHTAVADLAGLEDSELVAASSLYASAPMGPADQPDYVNAVVALETRLTPKELLLEMQAIERQHGRIRERHWGPRTLDLDLLLYGALRSDDPQLLIPHPGIAERAFVLVPLAEIAPDLALDAGKVSELADNCRKDVRLIHEIAGQPLEH